MTFRVEHRIGVAAPAAAVWDILSDLEGWARWNPLYGRAQGRLLIDAKLELEERRPGEAPRTIQAQVVDWVPNEQIHWREPGLLVKTTRYFEIEKLTDEACIVSNGVMAEGLLSRGPPRKTRFRMREGFQGMGEALKARAEAAFAERR